MVYRRAAGVDVTHPLTRFHPEIARPADKRPDELSCAESRRRARLASVHELAEPPGSRCIYSFRTGTLDFEELYLVAGVDACGAGGYRRIWEKYILTRMRYEDDGNFKVADLAQLARRRCKSS